MTPNEEKVLEQDTGVITLDQKQKLITGPVAFGHQPQFQKYKGILNVY